MAQILGCELRLDSHVGGAFETQAGARDEASRLRQTLEDVLLRLLRGEAKVWVPYLPPKTMSGVLGQAYSFGDGAAPGHFHPACELFIQLAGWTRFRFPDNELALKPGDLALLPPRCPHWERIGLGADDAAFENIVIYAEGGMLRCHFAREVSPGVPGIYYLESPRHPQAISVQEWFDEAAALAGAGFAIEPSPSLSEIQIRSLVATALAGVLKAIDDPRDEGNPEPPLVSRVRVMVQNQLGEQSLSVRRLADEAGCTADYLSNLFSVATGEHLTTYINRLRMERAQHLLRESDLAGKEVAWACGYSTQSYFIRAFRAHSGMTPKAWRQLNI